MPHRPPKDWFRRCESAVAESGSAIDPGAVCGAEWQKKSGQGKRAIVDAEEGRRSMSKKKPKKKHAKKSHAKRAKKTKKMSKKHKHLAAKHAAETRAFLARMRRHASGK